MKLNLDNTEVLDIIKSHLKSEYGLTIGEVSCDLGDGELPLADVIKGLAIEVKKN
jgi:hypothetical protein